MEKTEITLEYTEQTPHFGKMLLPKKEPKKPFPWKTLLQGGGFCLMGLFWGRIELMGLLRPMGLAYLSASERGGSLGRSGLRSDWGHLPMHRSRLAQGLRRRLPFS